MTIWGIQFAVTVFGNLFWGWIGDRFGWMRQMRWYGCWFCAAASLAFYYVPRVLGSNVVALAIAAVLLGMGVTAFVPMGAVFPALAPKEQGAAISINNLASGLTTFAGPGRPSRASTSAAAARGPRTPPRRPHRHRPAFSSRL